MVFINFETPVDWEPKCQYDDTKKMLLYKLEAQIKYS